MPAEAAGARAAPAAPALADGLLTAAAAWLRFRGGESLDRALAAALGGSTAGDVGEAAALAGASRDLVYAAARRLAVIEHIVAALAHRPPDAPVRALLAVSLAQLLARSYPEFTLVDQAVAAAARWPPAARAGGFVNAVLRSFLRRRAQFEAEAGADEARRWNLPPWWLRKLQSQYGARAEAMLRAQLEEPPLVLRVNARRTSVAQMLACFQAHDMPASRVGAVAIRLHRPLPVARIPGFAEGAVSVQDAGAQLAAPWLAPAAGMRVLDACAAPGGKLGHLLEIADCLVDAIDADAARAARVHANLRRLGFAGPEGAARARVIVADVLRTQAWWDGRPYERILLDAPCSASGVLRRHPDAAWLRRASDVAKLATRQAQMLASLWPLLAPAGRLLYVVCSVFAEEGRRQLAAFVRRQPGARVVALPGAGAPGEPAGVQLLPNSAAAGAATREGAEGNALPALHDGFYYALIEKT